MIERLITWSAHNRLLILTFTLLISALGLWATLNTPVDAIPDLSDVQVIIRTEYPGQAPQIVETQITYPLATAMLAVPGARTVRGYSMFGTSFVYVIFEDGTDLTGPGAACWNI
jgi:Cu(I)/Ag(I) efflux system membrane protein CusA/SilA